MTDEEEDAVRAIARAHEDANGAAAFAALAARDTALSAALEAALKAYDAVPIVRAADPREDARAAIAKATGDA